MPIRLTMERDSRYVEYVLLILLILLYAWMIFLEGIRIDTTYYFGLFDDAMISMRYARNLAEGYGLVWNPGEYIEGYSNLLWVLWMSMIHVLPIAESKICLIVSLSGIFILLTNLYVIKKIASIYLGNSYPYVIAILICVGFNFSFFFWTLRGMETGLVSLFINIAIYLLMIKPSMNRDIQLIVICVLMLLLRMDTLPVIVVIALYKLLKAPVSMNNIGFWGIVLCTIFTLLIWTVLRYEYYHQYLPNTYYHKLTGISLIERIERGVKALGYTCIYKGYGVYLFPLLFMIQKRMKIKRDFLLLVAVLSISIAYSVYVGGDAWERKFVLNRFISVGLPLLVILFVYTIKSLNLSIFHKRPFLRLVVIYGCSIAINIPVYYSWIHKGGIQTIQHQDKIKQGVIINEYTSPDTRVAVVWAGTIPYFSHRYAIDLLGKMDSTIARGENKIVEEFYPGHNKWNYAYSIDTYKPDLISRLWFPTPKDTLLLIEKGYIPLNQGFWMLKHSEYKIEPAFLQNF